MSDEESDDEIRQPVREETERKRESDEERATGHAETATVEDVAALRADMAAFAEEVEDRIIERETLENELKSYVRKRQRRGHARGWGPYLVLLYGTVMTLGAFFFLSGWYAILAMFVVWTSTLGLYTMMVSMGVFISMLRAPGRTMDRLQNFRS